MAPPPRPLRYSMPAPEEYFRGVSPLCRRILEDMATVRESYGGAWEQLTYEEQCKILDQTIVDEATVRRYESAAFSGPDCEYFPKLKLCTGQKIVSDEKLSARGYSCSWRDEHSAPFSWHTRSQMDLTLDTPPETPLDNSPPNPEGSEPCVPPKHGGGWGARHLPQQTEKPAPFLWHYAPQPDLKPPDPPDLVLASLNRNDGSGASPLLPRGANFNHVVVRASEREGQPPGFLGWFRGALSVLTGTCIPLHSCGSGTQARGGLHPGSPFLHPELRPPHVIAKAAKISLPMMAQPKKRKTATASSDESIFKSECPSTETETETTFTTDVASDRGSHAPSEEEKGSLKRDSQNRSILSNRNSAIMYGTFAEEDEEPTRGGHLSYRQEGLEPHQHLQEAGLQPIQHRQEAGLQVHHQEEHRPFEDYSAADNQLYYGRDEQNNSMQRGRSLGDDCEPRTAFSSDVTNFRNDVTNCDPSEADDYLPLISLATNNESAIPKTGFDFLDNW